jgi:hypothetical protein
MLKMQENISIFKFHAIQGQMTTKFANKNSNSIGKDCKSFDGQTLYQNDQLLFQITDTHCTIMFLELASPVNNPNDQATEFLNKSIISRGRLPKNRLS